MLVYGTYLGEGISNFPSGPSRGGGSMTPKWETRMQSLEAWGTSGLKNQVEQLMNETEKISRTPKVFIKIFLCT